jgi:hypothetical protein
MTAPTTAKWTNQEIKAIGEPLAKKLKEIDRKLTGLEDQSAWHKKEHAALVKRRTAAADGVTKLKALVSKSKDPDTMSVDPTKLAAEIDSILAQATAAQAKKRVVTYYYGKTKVAGEKAIEAKAKAVLPASDEGYASQAIHDAANGSKSKDAAVGGKGVKHASAGTKGVGSCSIFFTYEEHDGGLERRFVVVAVGGHAGPSSYKIYESFTPNLKVGKVVSL